MSSAATAKGASPLDAAQVRRLASFVRRVSGADRARSLSLQVASAVAALKTHLAKEAASKNGLFEDDDMFNLVRRRSARRSRWPDMAIRSLSGRPPAGRARFRR